MPSRYVIPIRYRAWMSELTPSETPRFLRPSTVTLVTGRYQCGPKTERRQRLLHMRDSIGSYGCLSAYATRRLRSSGL